MNLNTVCSKCGQNPASELHPCPFAEEINDNHEECDCCDECESECADEI